MAPPSYHRALRQQRRARKICQRCAREPVTDRVTCARCRAQETARYHQKKATS